MRPAVDLEGARVKEVSGGAKALWVYAPALIGLAIDQLTKAQVRARLPLGRYVAVAPHFNIFHVINKGGAFSVLYGNVWLLALVSIIVAVGLIVFERRRTTLSRWQAFALGILLGGTVGNLLDRAILGQVTDFLDVYVGNYHWPTFNVADVMINLGVLLLLFVFAQSPAQPHPREESSHR
jgi:signal peptidase II